MAPTAGLPKGSRPVVVAGSPDLYPFTGRCVPPAAQCCRPRHRVSRSTPTAQSKRQARSTYVRDHVFAADLGVDLFRPFQLEVGTHFENALLTVDQLLDRGPDADSTQVIFLTDGQPFGDRAKAQFPGLQCIGFPC